MRRRSSRAAGRHGRPGGRRPGPAAAGAAGVALAFARDRGGALVPAAALDAATRRSRAPFTCPGCGDELVVRLGAVRARHFAHRPGSACPLTAPETALHFNAKARLAALCALAFAGERAVRLQARCERCRRPVVRDLATAGDAAAEEGAVAGRRADVLVTRRGAAALALEVLVTHAVEPEKAAALSAAGVPWVELDARGAWEAEGPGGVIEVRASGARGLPPCRACRVEARAEADRGSGGEAAQVAELESYRARGLLAVDAPEEPPAGRPARHDRVKASKDRRLPDPVPGTFDPVPESFADDRGSGVGDEGRVMTASKAFAALAARFRCPDCGSTRLDLGDRLTVHPCPGHPPRPVAWVGYDGRPALLRWWKT